MFSKIFAEGSRLHRIFYAALGQPLKSAKVCIDYMDPDNAVMKIRNDKEHGIDRVLAGDQVYIMPDDQIWGVINHALVGDGLTWKIVIQRYKMAMA